MSPKQRSRLPADLSEALARQETPQFKWKSLLQIGGAAAVLWVTAFIMVPYVGYWGVGAVGRTCCMSMNNVRYAGLQSCDP